MTKHLNTGSFWSFWLMSFDQEKHWNRRWPKLLAIRNERRYYIYIYIMHISYIKDILFVYIHINIYEGINDRWYMTGTQRATFQSKVIWFRSRNCDCLVTWFNYQLIAKPGNKTATVPWADPYGNLPNQLEMFPINLQLCFFQTV